jgi:hypothetical protein
MAEFINESNESSAYLNYFLARLWHIEEYTLGSKTLARAIGIPRV